MQETRARIMISPEQRLFAERRWKLQETRIPELFQGIAQKYEGCRITFSPYNPKSEEWPSVSLRGPVSSWVPVIQGFPGIRISESAEVQFELRESDPYVRLLKKHKERRGGEVSDERVRAYEFTPAHIKSSNLALLEFVARQITSNNLLNPGNTKIDIKPLRAKLQELGSR